MPPARRRDLVTSRRRVADEGEEDDQETGSLGFDSPTEPSVLSDADDSLDADDSEGSANGSNRGVAESNEPKANGNRKLSRRSEASHHGVAKTESLKAPEPIFANTADIEAMVNGFMTSTNDGEDDAIQFEDMAISTSRLSAPSDIKDTVRPASDGRQLGQDDSKRTPSPVAGGQRNPEAKPKLNVDSSLVAATGGNVMQNRRSGTAGRGGFAPFAPSRPKRRGTGGPAGILHTQSGGFTSNRWNHDLHETVADPLPPSHAKPVVSTPLRSSEPTLISNSQKSTVSIGTVTCRLLLAGMPNPIVFEKMPVRQHTRLPEPRPPLRRDKPVRVSLPSHSPRYIFPSTERSFIFIPRAQRPNQQANRFRGRGGFNSQYGSRRTSIYGGSNYTSSIALSRRSSQARDGLISPTGSTFSRPPANIPTGPSRPVVRLPTAGRPYDGNTTNLNGIGPMPNGQPSLGFQQGQPFPLPSRPAFRENRDAQIPMHQPRPQKTVSVATIESPSSAPVHAPKQKEQQPFHQQFPAHIHGQPSPHEQSLPSAQTQQASGPQAAQTLSSTLPNRAVNAQPFQPNPHDGFFQPYPMQNMLYYPQAEQATQYGADHGPALYVQPTQQGSYLVPMLMGPPPPPPPPPPPNEGSRAESGTTVPYESNGTVYYYDPSQFGGNGESIMPANYAVPGAGGMMTPGPEGYYYSQPAPPPMVYFPTQQ